MNTVGEPYSGKPNVRIDEGRPGEAVPNRAAYSTADAFSVPVRFAPWPGAGSNDGARWGVHDGYKENGEHEPPTYDGSARDASGGASNLFGLDFQTSRENELGQP